MRLDAPVETFQVVFSGSILGIGHHGLNPARSILGMLIDKAREQMALVYSPRGYLGGGYDLGLPVHRPVRLVGKPLRSIALAHNGGIRIGGGNVSAIYAAILLTALRQVVQPGLELLVARFEVSFKRVPVDDRIH